MEVDVEVLLAVLQRVVRLLLQRGDEEPKARVVRLQALDVRQAEALVDREDAQESRYVAQPEEAGGVAGRGCGKQGVWQEEEEMANGVLVALYANGTSTFTAKCMYG